MDNTPLIFEGAISAEAVLKGKNREVYKIIIREGKPKTDTIGLENAATRFGVPVLYETAAYFEINSAGKTHGGIFAVAGERRYADLKNCRALLKDKSKSSFVVILEGVEDPFNLGYCVRTLYAAGADMLFLPVRDWRNTETVITKASTGAFEYMPICMSENKAETVELLKSEGYCIVCADECKDAMDLYNTEFPAKTALVIGGEKRGISKIYRQNADMFLKIPYKRDFKYSLTAEAAVSVIAYEYLRQYR